MLQQQDTWLSLDISTNQVVHICCWYEQIDERVRSRAASTHFGLKVLDQHGSLIPEIDIYMASAQHLHHHYHYILRR